MHTDFILISNKGSSVVSVHVEKKFQIGATFFNMITQLLRHVTSHPYDADAKREIFQRAIYPPSLVVIAFIFLELCPPPTPARRG